MGFFSKILDPWPYYGTIVILGAIAFVLILAWTGRDTSRNSNTVNTPPAQKVEYEDVNDIVADRTLWVQADLNTINGNTIDQPTKRVIIGLLYSRGLSPDLRRVEPRPHVLAHLYSLSTDDDLSQVMFDAYSNAVRSTSDEATRRSVGLNRLNIDTSYCEQAGWMVRTGDNRYEITQTGRRFASVYMRLADALLQH